MHLVKCERLDDFGRGIGKIDGKIIFIPDFLPNEEAYVNILVNKNKYMIGEVIELKKTSDDRCKFGCPYNNCGCALKNINYEKTLEYKKEKVGNILKRFGGVDTNISSIVSSPNIYNYRNKITLKVKDGKIGYFKNGTNQLIEINRCNTASDKINKIIGILKKEDLSLAKEIIIKDMDEVMVIIDGFIDINSLKKYSDSIFLNNKLAFGKNKISNHILDYKFLVSKDAFFQINNEVTNLLYSKVLEYAGDGDIALDLYSGTGTIGIILSKKYKKVISVEINKEAVECARENKKINNTENIEFKCGDANKLVNNMKADLIVVDPARSGLSLDGIKNIINVRPKKIIYISCNPITLARDIKMLKEFYNFKDITLFDMFPWTYHVEAITLLERK